MYVRLIRVYLPEASHLVTDSLSTLPACEDGKSTLELDLFLERNLCAGKQAHRHVWLSHRGKAARDRVVEPRRYELVSDLSGSGCYLVQTVVAHRHHSLLGQPSWLSFSDKRIKRQRQSCVHGHVSPAFSRARSGRSTSAGADEV